jgi:Peptidase family C25
VNLQLKITGTPGQYALDVNVPWAATGTHTLMALGWNQLATAASVKNLPSTWHTAQAGSDIVMITNAKFASSLQPLVKLRQSEGKTVSVVDVDDLYDEFNFGERSPYALRNFLASATSNWTKHPQYLLLVGDASLDPRNYLGTGYNDFVPTRIVETFYLKTASDEWFSDFNTTGIGQIATGRLPVRTVADAQTIVRKITGRAQATGPWSKQSLLVADIDGGLTFGADTQTVKKLLPSTVNANVADANILGITAARAQIFSQVNSGQLLVNYMGHGSVEDWAGGLLSNTDAATFTNSNRLPVFLIMDCLNGYFQDVYSTSMAESLLLAPNGGAVAVWSSSGLTDAAPQAELDKQAVGNMFSAQNPALGDAIRAAKAKVNEFDVRRTYILFGDPAMKLQK